MKKCVVIAVFVILTALSLVAQAQQRYVDVDREMVELLALSQQQALAYREIMQKQREAFFALDIGEWSQELALYRETFAMLKPVLTAKQLEQFIAILNSAIEDPQAEGVLVMEDHHCSTVVCE